MLAWFLTLLIATMLAFKFLALGALILMGVGVWALVRLLLRAGGVISGRRRPAEVDAISRPPRPVFRYDEVPPAPQPAAVIEAPKLSVSSRRASSSSWVFWAVLGLVATLALVGFRSRSRHTVEYRYVTAGNEHPRFVPVTDKARTRGSKKPAPATTVKTAAVKPPAVSYPTWNLTGHGETVDDAKEDACSKGWKELVDYLRRQSPPIEWTPPRDFVRKHMARKWGQEETVEFDDPLGKVIQIPLVLELTPQDQDRIARHDHHYRVEQRLTWVGKIFLGLVALLAAVAGYVRLDEWSKGYYTGLLRLAAAAFVVATAAGMWFLARQ
jgi:hypothetical protein